jgi:predicted permease
MVRDLIQDLRYGLCSLRRSSGFTAMVVLSLAVGIGANAAVFSLINFVFLRPLPVRDPGSLVLFSDTARSGDTGSPYEAGKMSLYPGPLYQRLRERSQSFVGLAAQQSGYAHALVRRDQPATDTSAEIGFGRAVTANYFGVLDVPMLRGRSFLPEDETTSGANPVVVLSHSFWQRRFGGDPALIGGQVSIKGTRYTVVGVAGTGFVGTRVGVEVTDFWVPMTMYGALTGRHTLVSDPKRGWLVLVGRLNPGASIEAAQAEVNVTLRQYLAADSTLVPDQQVQQRVQIALAPGGRGTSPLRRPALSAPLFVVMAAVGLLLLIVCLNVSHLLLTRAIHRQREMSIRTALGATRGRLVRQLLAEGLLLATAGGACAVLATSWMIDGLLALVPEGLPLALDVRADGRVLGFTGLLASGTAILLGLVPAWQASSLRLQPALQGASQAIAGGSRRLVSRVLLTSQVALSLVLLVGAGLCARTLGNLRALDKGFDQDRVLLVQMNQELAGMTAVEAVPFHEELLRRVNALPGVRSASLSQLELLGGGHSTSVISTEGASSLEVDFGKVTTTYFETVGMRVLRGRGFGPGDVEGAPAVAVINRTLERQLFGGNAVGRRFKDGRPSSQGRSIEVVGVLEDAKNNGLRDAPLATVYRPVAQVPTVLGRLQVLAAGDPALLADQVRRAVREVRPDVPVTGVRTMRGQVERVLTGERALATLSSAFGLVALFLVCVGLYGVIGQWAAQRTRELGVRIALGATAAGVRWLVLRQAFVLVGAGLLVGLPAAVAVGRLLRGFLFGLSPMDPATLTGAALLILIVASAAAFLPARRASRLDPMTALRSE